MTQPAARPIAPRFAWTRFRLRTLLIVVTAVCLVAGLMLNGPMQHRRLRAQARANLTRWGAHVMVIGQTREPTPGRNWLSEWLGISEPLEELWSVHLHGPQFSSKNLESLANCGWIRFLELSVTSASDADMDTIARMTNLRELRLNHSRVTDRGIQKLHTLTNLAVLRVNASDVSYEGLAELERQLPGSTFLEQRALQNLSGQPFALWTSQQTMYLSSNQDVTYPAHHALAERVFYHAPQAVTTKQIEDLRRLKHLESMSCNLTTFPPGGLSWLPDLIELNDVHFEGENLTDADLAWIAQLPKLERLSLSSDNLHDEGLAPLKTVRSLKRLTLSGRNLTAGAMNILKDMPQLTELSLRFRCDDDGKPGELADTELQLTRAQLAQLQTLPSLRRLTLAGDVFVDHTVEVVGQFKSLQQLTLSKSFVSPGMVQQLTASIPKVIAK